MIYYTPTDVSKMLKTNRQEVHRLLRKLKDEGMKVDELSNGQNILTMGDVDRLRRMYNDRPLAGKKKKGKKK